MSPDQRRALYDVMQAVWPLVCVCVLRKKSDYSHINLTRLDAIKSVNLALKWGLKEI